MLVHSVDKGIKHLFAPQLIHKLHSLQHYHNALIQLEESAYP